MKLLCAIVFLAYGCVTSKGGVQNFPESSLDERKDRHERLDGWYSKHLKRMKEPSLLKAAQDQRHVYRFLWLRTFHHPIAIRLVIEDSGAGSIVATVLSGQGGYKPGRVKQRERVSLSSEQVQEFLELIELINYWEMPGSDHSNIGFDGAQWILEGARDGEYHVVDRWSPEHGEYRTTCLQLLEWSGLNVEKKY